MPDWDQNSAKLSANLAALLRSLRDTARERGKLSHEDAKEWHRRTMEGLTADDPKMIGAYRGEPGMDYNVRVGPNWGTPPDGVAGELEQFQRTLDQLLERLDASIAPGAQPNTAQIEAVVAVCGWVHAEWIRIHPFANGNGRTARIWANVIAMRYGLPPFVRLRPRPEGTAYARAGAAAMQGEHKPTVRHFKQMLPSFLTP